MTDCEDDSCIDLFGQCGGSGFNVSAACCYVGASCVVKNYQYAQCLLPDNFKVRIDEGWDGRAILCEEMPEDLLPQTVYKELKPEFPELTYMMRFGQCGGENFNVSEKCCEAGTSCIVKNQFYAQCLTEADANQRKGWDGRALVCDEMPPDVAGIAGNKMPAANRRLLSGSDCKDDTCATSFQKCGGKGFNISVSCCDPTESCVVKNAFYAQCITEKKATDNVANGWDGAVVECEEMPDSVIGPIVPPRRLQQVCNDFLVSSNMRM
jgi:hypothetical protein